MPLEEDDDAGVGAVVIGAAVDDEEEEAEPASEGVIPALLRRDDLTVSGEMLVGVENESSPGPSCDDLVCLFDSCSGAGALLFFDEVAAVSSWETGESFLFLPDLEAAAAFGGIDFEFRNTNRQLSNIYKLYFVNFIV